MSWDADDQAAWREKMRGVVPAPAPRSGEPVVYPVGGARFTGGPLLEKLLAAATEDPDYRAEWTPAEPEEVLAIFTEMLRAATGDGAAKRRSGEKPSWKVDPGHETALFSHLHKWKNGELADKDSGAHPLVHLAWRALAIAYQENGGLQHASKYRKPERPTATREYAYADHVREMTK